MLFAALASVVIATCYDGDTCTTTTGERVRLACIDTPEMQGERANPIPAIKARDRLRSLVVGRTVDIRQITTDRHRHTLAELSVDGSKVQQQLVVSGHADIYWNYVHQYSWTEDQ